MTENILYHVVLFDSVTMTMRAEKILKNKSLSHKLIPVPRHISSDCGVCIRFNSSLVGAVKDALSGKLKYKDIRPLIHGDTGNK
jgi:hypothetical protein